MLLDKGVISAGKDDCQAPQSVIHSQAGIQTPVYARTQNRRSHPHS